MTDNIGHECGLGMIRLRKPLEWYQEHYGTSLWGLNRMYLLMEKMHNRGQDGAGLAVVKSSVAPGNPYIHRVRNVEQNPWIRLNLEIQEELSRLVGDHKALVHDAHFLELKYPWLGEIMMAHLRYGTHGGSSIEYVHPFIRHSNWRAKTLAMAGNFNLTNVDELFDRLLMMGQHPPYLADTVTIMERVGHFLETAMDEMIRSIQPEGTPTRETYREAEAQLDIHALIRRAAVRWDGGYVMGGLIGTGDGFVTRDPQGIRPAYYYIHEDYIVVASERPAIATAFHLEIAAIQELLPGHTLWMKRNGEVDIKPFTDTIPTQTSCSFERIYFSRGNDPDIYRERKALGRQIVPKILQAIDHDLVNTVFSYIPNTSETAFLGMTEGLERYLDEQKRAYLQQMKTSPGEAEINHILGLRLRVEKVVIKDVKLRTFITDDANRDDLVAHVYDITHGILHTGQDSIVCIDDSIVRGTTLKKSILRMLGRLKPVKIVIVSSAPQIRYPDCYGIDMSKLSEFVAFQAAIALLKSRKQESLLESLYLTCLQLEADGELHTRNVVKDIYASFSVSEISDKIAELLTPEGLGCKVSVVYPDLEDLKLSIPHHTGDWYFSGNYPTPGGNRVVNRAFMNFMEGKLRRSY